MHHVEMNSEYKKKDVRKHTSCCCAEFTNSISQNPRIRSNNHKETGSLQGEQTGQGNQEKHQHPERKSAGYHSATVVPDSHPNFLSYKEFAHNNFIFVENPSHSS